MLLYKTLCWDDWPCWCLLFPLEHSSHHWSYIGESVMVPLWWSYRKWRPAQENCRNQLLKCPYSAIFQESWPSPCSSLVNLQQKLAALSVVFRFFQYIPTALVVLVLRKKYPDKKWSPRSIWSSNLTLWRFLVSLVMIWGETQWTMCTTSLSPAQQHNFYLYSTDLKIKFLNKKENESMTHVINLMHEHLTLEDVIAVARHGATCEIDQEAKKQ